MSDDPPNPDEYGDNPIWYAMLHFSAVGAVATGWAGFEVILDSCTLELGRIPRRAGSCLTAQISGWGKKFDAYMAIARLRGADVLMKECDALLKESASLAERRNRAVHDPWWKYDKPGSMMRFEITARRKLKEQYVEVSEAQLFKLSDEIAAHAHKFHELHEKILAAVGT